MKNYKTIAIFTYASEYTVLRHLLEQAEIRHVFQNEITVNILPFHSNALGGIRLQVHEEDIAQAVEIIENLKRSGNLRIV